MHPVDVSPKSSDESLPNVHHIGIVVRDCAAKSAELAALTGRPFMAPFEDRYENVLVEGVRSPFSLRLSFATLGNLLIELLEPMDDRSPHAAFLESRGEGLHHLGFRVERMDEQISRLQGHGLRRIVDAGWAPNTSHWVYMADDFASGEVIELMSRTPEGDRFFADVDAALRRDAGPQ